MLNSSVQTLGSSLSPLILNQLAKLAGIKLEPDSDDGDGRATFVMLSVVLSGGVSEGVSGTLVVSDYNLASALCGWGKDLFKSDHAPIPADARWITVHPNGEGSKGVAVLVQPAKDNSGVFRVIGGAGGKLNMLKLRGVKSVGEYQKDSARRAGEKRRAKAEQKRKEKELGTYYEKEAARKDIIKQRKKAQDEFVKTVADSMGWTRADMEIDVSGLSEAATKKALRRNRTDLLTRAKQAVGQQRQLLVADSDRREAAGLGVVPLGAGDDALLSVSDLDPVHIPDTSGVSPDFKARAEVLGLTDEKLDEQVAEIQDKDEAGVAASVKRGEIAAGIRKELEGVDRPTLSLQLVDAKRSVALIKAQKRLAAMEKQAREAVKSVDSSLNEPKAFVLSVSDPTDEEVAETVKADLATVKAKAFLAGVEGAGGEDSVVSHISEGAYNAINALAQTVGGGSMLDRSVVDVLGIAGAAQVLSHRLAKDYPDKLDEIASGLEEYHVSRSGGLEDESLARAKELQDMAAEIEVGEAANASDLAVASAMNHKRKQYLADARQVLGQALGEMEGSASMIAALRGKDRDYVQVSLGHATLSSAVKQLWAIGLTDADYKVSRVAGNVFVNIHSSGMEKLATPVDRENMDRVGRNLSIMRGDQDEDGWQDKARGILYEKQDAHKTILKQC